MIMLRNIHLILIAMLQNICFESAHSADSISSNSPTKLIYVLLYTKLTLFQLIILTVILRRRIVICATGEIGPPSGS